MLNKNEDDTKNVRSKIMFRVLCVSKRYISILCFVDYKLKIITTISTSFPPHGYNGASITYNGIIFLFDAIRICVRMSTNII